MAKVKVKVLYPSAFVALGVPADAETAEVDQATAETLIGSGWAELVETKKPVAEKKAAS